jgi:hypothetical protein
MNRASPRGLGLYATLAVLTTIAALLAVWLASPTRSLPPQRRVTFELDEPAAD